MIELIKEILILAVPIVVSILITVIVPCIIKKIAKILITKKLDEIDNSFYGKLHEENVELKEELETIKKEILEMRGKLK